MHSLNCLYCNIEFNSIRSDTKYCCSQHAHKHNYELNMLNPEWRLKKLMSMAKNRAIEKNLPFDLDIDYLINCWVENDGCCNLTGQEFDLTNYGNKGQVNPQAPSIDRIIPKLGYVKGNIRLITYHMNVALADFGIDEFEKLINNYLIN